MSILLFTVRLISHSRTLISSFTGNVSSFSSEEGGKYWPPSSTLIFHPCLENTRISSWSLIIFWTVSNFVTIGTKIESSDISNHDTRRLKNLAVLHDDKRGTPVVPHCFAGCFTRHRNIASFLSSWPLEGSTFFCRGPTKSRNMTSSSHLLFICLLSFRGENCALTALCYVTYVKTIIKNTASG